MLPLSWPLVAPALQALTGSGAEGPLPLHHRWHAPARVRREAWDAARGNLADWVAATRVDEPVVLVATPASKWRAVRRWGPAYLAEHAAGDFELFGVRAELEEELVDVAGVPGTGGVSRWGYR